MPKHHPQSIKDDCVRLRREQRMSVCQLSHKFGLATGTIYPWIRHIRLERREWRAPSTTWTPKEIATLRAMWPFSPWSEIIAAIPRHTKISIGKRAADLKLKRHREANAGRKKNIDPLFVMLRRAREVQGLTRKQLARKLGYHYIQMARWELGDTVPPWRAIKIWADTVGREIVIQDKIKGGERFVVSRDI